MIIYADRFAEFRDCGFDLLAGAIVDDVVVAFRIDGAGGDERVVRCLRDICLLVFPVPHGKRIGRAVGHRDRVRVHVPGRRGFCDVGDRNAGFAGVTFVPLVSLLSFETNRFYKRFSISLFDYLAFSYQPIFRYEIVYQSKGSSESTGIKERYPSLETLIQAGSVLVDA